MKEKMGDFLYFAVDIVILIMSVTMIIWLFNSQYDFSINIQEASSIHTTVSKTTPENTTYEGYIQDGKVVYDGLITGKQVYTDILNNDSINIAVRSNSYHDLRTELYNNKNLLNYARNDDPTVLISQNVIDLDAEYLRKYMRNTDGEVTQTIYEKQ